MPNTPHTQPWTSGRWTDMPSREIDDQPEEDYERTWTDQPPPPTEPRHSTEVEPQILETVGLRPNAQPHLPSIPPDSIRSFRITARHELRTRRNEDRWFLIGTHNGLYALQFGNEALITKHNPNKCAKCYMHAEEFESGSHRTLPYTVASITDFGNGRYDRSSVHTAVPRNDGTLYTLPTAVITIEETSNTLPWRTRFTNESRLETEHDPRHCWECIMAVTRYADNVEHERREVTGHSDGDMDLETGGFWFNGSFVRSDNSGLPPDTQIRLNERTNQFEMVTPNGEIFRTAEIEIVHTTADEIKESMQNIFQKIDDNEELLQKFKQHLLWFDEYGVK